MAVTLVTVAISWPKTSQFVLYVILSFPLILMQMCVLIISFALHVNISFLSVPLEILALHLDSCGWAGVSEVLLLLFLL